MRICVTSDTHITLSSGALSNANNAAPAFIPRVGFHPPRDNETCLCGLPATTISRY